MKEEYNFPSRGDFNRRQISIVSWNQELFIDPRIRLGKASP